MGTQRVHASCWWEVCRYGPGVNGRPLWRIEAATMVVGLLLGGCAGATGDGREAPGTSAAIETRSAIAVRALPPGVRLVDAEGAPDPLPAVSSCAGERAWRIALKSSGSYVMKFRLATSRRYEADFTIWVHPQRGPSTDGSAPANDTSHVSAGRRQEVWRASRDVGASTASLRLEHDIASAEASATFDSLEALDASVLDRQLVDGDFVGAHYTECGSVGPLLFSKLVGDPNPDADSLNSNRHFGSWSLRLGDRRLVVGDAEEFCAGPWPIDAGRVGLPCVTHAGVDPMTEAVVDNGDGLVPAQLEWSRPLDDGYRVVLVNVDAAHLPAPSSADEGTVRVSLTRQRSAGGAWRLALSIHRLPAQ